MFDEALVDLGFKGQKFTWKRGREGETFKGARLDRALCFLDWLDKFPDTSVTHLTMLKSDHCPILVEIDRPQIHSQRMFKFQGVWRRHPNFLDLVRDTWNTNDIVWANKDITASKLMDWNQSTFGNIHHIKKRLLKRLEEIQNNLDTVNHSGIIKLERKLRKELEEFLYQEEIMWFQQARENWVTSGGQKHEVLPCYSYY